MKTSKDYNVCSRIGELIETLGISKAEFARRIGVSRVAVSVWLNESNGPSETTMREICRQFNVDYNWLKYGKFEMFLQTPKNFTEQIQRDYDLSDDEVAFVVTYLESDKQIRESLTKFNNLFIINQEKLSHK